MAQTTADRSSTVTFEHLLGVVGRNFRTRDPSGRPLELKLIGVTDMRPKRRLPPDAPRSVRDRDGTLVATSTLDLREEFQPLGPTRIGLLFQGPRDRSLPDGVYDLEINWLPLRDVHLSPIDTDPRASGELVFYESVLG